jgi:hypothetical protein
VRSEFDVKKAKRKCVKKIPANGIFSPPSILRGKSSWHLIKGRSEVNFKFCRWLNQYDMASFVMKNSLMTILGDYDRISL